MPIDRCRALAAIPWACVAPWAFAQAPALRAPNVVVISDKLVTAGQPTRDSLAAPGDADFAAFTAAMQRLQGRKVLVHCQVNMRASTFVFLHRAVNLREPPEQAYEAVAKVWSPSGVWRRFALARLQQANIRFEPY